MFLLYCIISIVFFLSYSRYISISFFFVFTCVISKSYLKKGVTSVCLTATKGKNTKVWRDPDPRDVNKMWNQFKVYWDTGPTRPSAVLCCVCLLARDTAVRSQSVWSVTQSHCCLKVLQVMWLNLGNHESCFSDRHKLQTFRLDHRISAQNLCTYIYIYIYIYMEAEEIRT